jgi:hypothetical protein
VLATINPLDETQQDANYKAESTDVASREQLLVQARYTKCIYVCGGGINILWIADCCCKRKCVQNIAELLRQ